MALIATLLSDRARREGSAYIGRTDLDLVDELGLGQVVIIKDTASGDKILGWVSDVIDTGTETVYRFALGPVLPARMPGDVPEPRDHRHGLQHVEQMLDQARQQDLQVPKPRRPRDD